jgi:hypothetical protein
MAKETLKVGSLVFTRTTPETDKYTYETNGTSGIRIQLALGWKGDKAVAFVRYPKDGWTVESIGELPSVIESALNEVEQGLEQEVRKAKKKLESFRAQSSEILAAIKV